MISRFAFSCLSFLALTAAWATDDAAPKNKPGAGSNSPDVTVVGQILKEDAPDRVRNVPSKVHALRLAKDKAYVVELTGEGIIPFVHLEDSTGAALGQGMNRVNNVSRLRFTAPKDDVFLFHVVSLGGNEGKYTLSVKPLAAAAVNLIELPTPAAGKPTEIQGQLKTDDPPDQYWDFPGKMYTVELKNGKTYVIDLMSTQFDAYLLLQNANAGLIAQDDDSGGNLNSRIRFQAPASARYRIVASTFNGQVGAFTLRVTEQP